MPKKRVFLGAGGAAGPEPAGGVLPLGVNGPGTDPPPGTGPPTDPRRYRNRCPCRRTLHRRCRRCGSRCGGSGCAGGFLLGSLPFPLRDGAVRLDEQRRVAELRRQVLIGDPQPDVLPGGLVVPGRDGEAVVVPDRLVEDGQDAVLKHRPIGEPGQVGVLAVVLPQLADRDVPGSPDRGQVLVEVEPDVLWALHNPQHVGVLQPLGRPFGETVLGRVCLQLVDPQRAACRLDGGE